MTIAQLPVSPAGEITHGDVRLKINEMVARMNQFDSGWASYVDTQYTSVGTALTIAASTDTILPNNAGNVLEFQKPESVPSFYDGSTIQGQSGNSIDILLYFKAIPSINNQDLDIWIDIGGSVGELYRESYRFPRGAGVERGIVYSLASPYTLSTWQANGGTIYINTSNSMQVYGMTYNFDLSHKAI